MPASHRHAAAAACLGALLVASRGLAAAEPPAPPQGVASLSSSASAEVARDLISIVFSTQRDGSDPTALQSQLKQALDAALTEARKAARPGLVEVQTGNFMLVPRYGPKGAPSGWQGSVELIVEGRDVQAISQLAGRISTLTIARVGYGLSRELRERTEAEVSAQAIGRFRARAAEVAKQFGYAGYTVREVSVGSSEQAPGPRPMMMSRAAAAGPSEEALPVEPGKGSVTVNVTGTVQLTR